MIRQIIKIEEDLCNGCELCVSACHEGAIAIIDGKAKLIRDDYCDGLGNCLPVCPTGAISFEEREADAFDEAAVEENMKKVQAEETAKAAQPAAQAAPAPFAGCPGTRSRTMDRTQSQQAPAPAAAPVSLDSQLNQWPVQIKLVPVNAPYFHQANLLIAADCTAFAYGDFHNQFMKNKITLIGCPKLDEGDYSEKLTAILKHNDIKSLTVVRMEVPCCGGIQHAAVTALKASGKMIPWQIVTISTDGQILE